MSAYQEDDEESPSHSDAVKIDNGDKRRRESLSFQLAFHNEFRFYDGERGKTNWRAGSAMVLIAKMKMLITDSKFPQ